jgi:biopolymer transport protein TolR
MRESAKHLNRSRVGFRTIAIKPEIHAQSELNVTPLIDVVLVLLIIFMVITPVVERELEVALPAEKRAARPADVAPRQLTIQVDDAGALKLNDELIARDGYVEYLRPLLEGRPPAERIVFVTASDGVRYPYLVEVIDGAKLAGAVRVGLAIEGSP